MADLTVSLPQRALETDLVIAGSPSPTVGHIQGILQSVVKEALNNVVKHAKATQVLVSVRNSEDRADLVVQDDGVGIGDAILRTYADDFLHFGLRHIDRQLRDVGGMFEVGNGEERGVMVRVSVPLHE
jgi:signal transduction histidine kinase